MVQGFSACKLFVDRCPGNKRGLKSTQYGVFSVVSIRCDVSRWGNQQSRKFRPNHRRPIVQYSHRSPEPHGIQSSRKTQSVIELEERDFPIGVLPRQNHVLSQPNRSSGDIQSPWVHILSKDPFPAEGEPKVYPVKILNQSQEFLHPFGPKDPYPAELEPEVLSSPKILFPADTAAVVRV